MESFARQEKSMSIRAVEEELDTQKTLGYRPELDGLRGAAILGVVSYHYFRNWFRASVVGVDLFFVLSGFLITRLMLEEHRRYGRVSLRNFYAKRIGRLLPAIVALVAATLLVGLPFLEKDRHELIVASIGALTFSMNWFHILGIGTGEFGHLWSTAIEEQFYLVWPLLFIFVAGRVRRISWVAACVAIATGLNYSIRGSLGEEYGHLFYGSDTRAPMMLMGGCWLATTLAVRRPRPLNQRLLTVVFLAAVGLRTAFVLISDRFLYKDLSIYGGLHLSVILMMLVIVGTLELDWLRRLLSGRLIGWVGRLAYGIFLWHLPVQAYLPLRSVPTLAIRNLVHFLITLVVAVASYFVIEQPARKWIVTRFGDPARRPSSATPVTGAVSA